MTGMTRMLSSRLALSLVVLAFVQVLNVSQAFAQGFRPGRPVEGVYKDRIIPHWLTGNTRF